MLDITMSREIKITPTFSQLTTQDIRGTWKARWGIKQMNYKVEPKALEVKPGVGCASAIIKGWLTGSEPNCDCSDGSCC
ncbi:hypothetical protein [Desulfosporosinus sp.]|uniref:hypothetical protein n=1 Tax=Desulfosporosinus sp. TaxID=157907 RepID=UPI002320CBA3|nr:hypothetical protein [Desulfosporosinus sp.]MCO5387513.1 hypothetical protein [Desulfosporosinus sp.]MDA8220964.1 hypothetical protein [Desulfitobacterium hafniense]